LERKARFFAAAAAKNALGGLEKINVPARFFTGELLDFLSILSLISDKEYLLSRELDSKLGLAGRPGALSLRNCSHKRR
jgi:hypothetical protein